MTRKLLNWFGRRCPRTEELERMVTAGAQSARITRHVAECAACNKIVRDLRCDTELLYEIRTAVEAGLEAPVRARIVGICRAAVEEVQSADGLS